MTANVVSLYEQVSYKSRLENCENVESKLSKFLFLNEVVQATLEQEPLQDLSEAKLW